MNLTDKKESAKPFYIDWQPKKNTGIPVYQQIVKFICEKIYSGQWAIGTYLPTQRNLAKQFNVNRSTITAAFDELTSYGIIQGEHGAGTRIINNTWSIFLQDTPNWNKRISSGVFKANNTTVQAINTLEAKNDFIRLGTGELDPDLFPTDIWQNILQKLSSKITSLGYLPPCGLYELRCALSNYLKIFNINVPPSCILITSGAIQALQMISISLLKPNTLIFTEAPTYLKSLQIFQSAGMKLHGISMDKQGICINRIDTALKHIKLSSSVIYTIPTNHNPTGITMNMQRRRELLNFCVANQIPIIEDGAYNELCYDNLPPATLKSLDTSDMVIYLGSASKFFAPGLRVGWIAASEPIIQRLSDVKMSIDYGASSISQYILAEFFYGGFYKEYLAYIQENLKQRRDNAINTLERYFKDIAFWNYPRGGFYIWLTLKNPISMEKLFTLASKENILLNIGDIYDFKKNNSLRLSFSYLSPNEFTSAAKHLAQIIKSMY